MSNSGEKIINFSKKSLNNFLKNLESVIEEQLNEMVSFNKEENTKIDIKNNIDSIGNW